MQKPGKAATWGRFQPWNKPRSTSARCSTSRNTEERRDRRCGCKLRAARCPRSSIPYWSEKTVPHTTKKWSGRVTTDSTHPPEGLFTKNPETIARSLASKRVSPEGPTSGMRMLTFFINRAGKGLRAKLQKAKELLSERVKAEWTRNKKKAA